MSRVPSGPARCRAGVPAWACNDDLLYHVEVMGARQKERVPKRLRRELRDRQARRKHVLKRARQVLLVLGLLLPIALLAFDQSGQDELVDAEVIRTQLWRHVTPTGSHNHTRAIISIEGLTEQTLERADGFQRGQLVPVWIRRGQLTGWVSFQDLAKPGEISRQGNRDDP